MDGDVLNHILNSPRLARDIAGAISMSKTEQIITGLKRFGAVEVKSRSAKYRTFIDPRCNGRFIFVGKKGAVRVGRTSSKSVPLSDANKQSLMLASQASAPVRVIQEN